jgi:hypothetical protein
VGRIASFAVVVALSMGLCSCRRLTSPEPPDMSAVLAAYAGPTAPLDVALATALAERARADAQSVDSLDGLSIVTTVINGLQGGSASPIDGTVDAAAAGDGAPSGLIVGDTVIDGDGYLILEHRCPGWADDTEDPGTMRLTVLVRDTAIYEVVWGSLERCRLTAAGTDVEASLTLAVHLDRRISIQQFHPLGITASIDGSVRVRADPTANPVSLDFRVSEGGALQFRVQGATGHVVATVGASVWQVEATNGVFACDFDARRCTDGSGGEVTW